MKKTIQILILSLIFSSFNPAEQKPPIVEIDIVTSPLTPILNEEVDIVNPKNLIRFLEDLGHSESRGRYDIENSYGYLGKYQFGMSTLKGLGYKISDKDFLNSPHIQEEAMLKLLNHNKKHLKKYIERYQGKNIRGIFITESGILAAAHLGGPRNVKRWFKGKRFKDGYGTSLSDYMDKFSNYDLNISN